MNALSPYELMRRCDYDDILLRHHWLLYDPGAVYGPPLAESLGMTEEDMRMRALCHYASRGFRPSVGTYGGPLKHTQISQVGSPFCPECLATEDGWRLGWLLPFVAACTRHTLILQTGCPSCQEPVGPLSTIARRNPTAPTACVCGYDLRTTPARAATAELHAAQSELIDPDGQLLPQVAIAQLEAIALYARRLAGAEGTSRWPDRSALPDLLPRAVQLSKSGPRTIEEQAELGFDCACLMPSLRASVPFVAQALQFEPQRRVGGRTAQQIFGHLEIPVELSEADIPHRSPPEVWGPPCLRLNVDRDRLAPAELGLGPAVLRSYLRGTPLLGSFERRYDAATVSTALRHTDSAAIALIARRSESLARWCRSDSFRPSALAG